MIHALALYSTLVMYSGSKSRGRVGFGVYFEGSGRVWGSIFRGHPPQVLGPQIHHYSTYELAQC